ncbi:uncharacterized protein LOC117304991 isoform X2 [Asterias rubens]|nr:uncharacterized protein LOC117304991 isoform X2 [Asterias rubens]
MSDALHWNELPAQIDSIIADVWAKLEVDKQLQQAQEQIDEINNGHSKIGEIFDSVEQGLIDLDTELHPVDSNGQPTSFYADIKSSLANVQTEFNELQQTIDEFEASQDNVEPKEDFVFVYSDESMSPSPLADHQDDSMDTTLPNITAESTTASVSPSHQIELHMEVDSQPDTDGKNESLGNDSTPHCEPSITAAHCTQTNAQSSIAAAHCTQTNAQALSESVSAGSPKSQLKLSDNAALSTSSTCDVSPETLSSTSDLCEPLAKTSSQSSSAGTTVTPTNTLSELPLNSSTDTLSKATRKSKTRANVSNESTSRNSTNDPVPTLTAEFASGITTRGLAKNMSESSRKIASESPTTSNAPKSTNTSGKVVSDTASTRKTRMSSKVSTDTASSTADNDSVRASVTTRSRYKETCVPASKPTSSIISQPPTSKPTSSNISQPPTFKPTSSNISQPPTFKPTSSNISQPMVKLTLNEPQILKGAVDLIKSSTKPSPVVNTEKSITPVAHKETAVCDELDVIDLCDGEDLPPMEDDEDDVIETLPTKTHKLPSLEKLGPGIKVLAQQKSNTWKEATIISVIKGNNEQKKYRISFDRKIKSLVSSKHLAVHTYPCGYPAPSLVHIGSRIVAECMNPLHGSYMCAGIVAELPLCFNKGRYLVFFDDGCVQYMSLKKVHLVYEVSYNVWEDVPERYTEFIKEYLEKYPERPMVRLHRGQCIKTEAKGVWWRAKVQEVDGSLVNMHFPSSDRLEWIYRGSPRMEPLHRELETAKYLRESGRLIAGSSVSKKRGGPCVEYQRVNSDFLVSEKEILAMLEGKITVPKGIIAQKLHQSKVAVPTRTIDRMPVVQWAIASIREWYKTQSSGKENFENLPNEELAAMLEGLYKNGYQQQPDIYTSHTLKALRCSLSTFLTEPPISRIIDINKAPAFVKANQVFNETIRIIDKVKEPPPKKLLIGQPEINKRDLVKLLRSGLVSLSNPLGLLRLVWIFMQIFVGKTKGKIKSIDLDLLQRKDVIAKKAKSGLPYFEINSAELGLSGGQEQKIYATGNRFYCPYYSINLYITKLNPDCQDFLQKPRTRINFKQESVWFDPEPHSSASISTMMYDIASAARLSKPYSNVDIRATVWTDFLEAIEEFTQTLRLGYKSTSATTSMTTSTSTTTSVVNKHGVQQPKIQVNIKPDIPKEVVIGKSTVRQNLFHQPATTKQTTSQDDSDEDVILIEDSTQPARVNKSMHHSFSPSASHRLLQLSRTYEKDKQQTAKKSTSHSHAHNFPGYQHDKKHRHNSRHSGYTDHRQDLNRYQAHMASRELNRAMDDKRRSIQRLFVHHNCSWTCVAPYVPDAKRKEKIKSQNPLRVPEMYGWVRRLAKQKGSGRRHVVYQAPCGRSLRDMGEVDRYLTETKMTDLSVDLFSFDQFVITKLCKYRNSQRPFLKIADISEGAEPVPVSLVNVYDREQPPAVKYIAHRKPEKGSKIITDPGFLICCDCTDNCKDNRNCACRKLSVESAKALPEINKDVNEIGYKYRQLHNLVSTGIYECNSKCSCSKQCHNKVVQNGLRLRLQVFKTEKRGWGLRCLDDIPQGAFVCIYAGQLWGAEEANIRGQKYGDEYFAELDHIEIVENSKEGYESDVMEDEGISKDSSSSASSSSEQCLSSDDEYHVGSDDSDISSVAVDVENHSDDSVVMVKGQSGDSTATKMVFRRQQQSEQGTGSVVEGSCWSVEFPEKASSQSKVEAWVNSTLPDPVDTPAEESGRATGKSDALVGSYGQRSGLIDYSTDRSAKNSTSSQESKPVARKSSGAKKEQSAVKRGMKKENYREGADESSRDSSTSSMINYGYNTSPGKVLDHNQLEAFKRRSLTGRLHMRKKSKDGNEEGTAVSPIVQDKSKEIERPLNIRTRSFFAESSGHVMDAKFIGNLGRYLNHSCNPNVFVQSVFVDSHDLRFPWVAFFAKKYVRAGSELTWDYNYDVGSVPGKSLICLCGSAECRGRLL